MTSLKVAVRVRPFNNREREMGAKLVVHMDGSKTQLRKPKTLSEDDFSHWTKGSANNYHEFTFDYSYWSFGEADNYCDAMPPTFTAQSQVYADLGTDVVDCAFNGYNACVFAYGQTGSGKTFTMMGNHGSSFEEGATENDNQGLIPRICHSLFERMHKSQETESGYYKTDVSYLEIYNERVKDLLADTAVPDNDGHKLKVREHKITGPYVENLSQHPVTNYSAILDCIHRGNRLRTTASTNMNDTSSRSHAIFTITFVQANWQGDLPSETVSKVHLVDLAGSERANATGATGQRLKEGAHINKSLVTLGCVISSLAEQAAAVSTGSHAKRMTYVPYRDSVLTWLLKDSLGGNSKTIMIAAISPADCNYGETLSTLRYANRAKNIINKPTVNEDSNVKLIRELREEIFNLRRLLNDNGSESGMLLNNSKFLEDLQKKEAQEKVLTEEWNEKWREAQNILREQKSLGLRKSGYGVVLDSEVPHLIGIHDGVSTGVTLYSLKEGQTSIGRDEAGDENAAALNDIALTGDDDVLQDHCSIVLANGIATIHPRASAKCWLNARLIEEPTKISQGDILLLGRTNMFRYNNPMEAAQLRRGMTASSRNSRLDLSRLSMIAVSRENLSNSMSTSAYNVHQELDDSKEEDNNNMETLPAPATSAGASDDEKSGPEMMNGVKGNSDLLCTIETALNQLQMERDLMYGEYKSKVLKLAKDLEQVERDKRDRLTILQCQERELLARKEMLVWVKNNEQLRIDILLKQIATLKSEFDSKRMHLSTIVDRLLNDLCVTKDGANYSPDDVVLALYENDKDKLPFQVDAMNKADRNKVLELKRVKDDLEAKQQQVQASEESVAGLTREISQLEADTLIVLQKTEEELANIASRKQKMSLDLGPVDAEEKPKASTLSCESYHTAQMDCGAVGEGQASPPQDPLRLDQTVLSPHSQRNVMVDSGVEILSSDRNHGNYKWSLSDFEATLDGDDGSRSGTNRDRPNSSQRLDQMEGEEDVNTLEDGDDDDDEDSRNLSLLLQHELTAETIFTIPNYIIRGAGKQTHYEYEIRICTVDDRWTLLRRYSRFRDLHTQMRSQFGVAVKALPFPKKSLFGKSENVARIRRQQLEDYLQKLLAVVLNVPGNPMATTMSTITKQDLCDLSSFFRKGLFECGKHGTG